LCGNILSYSEGGRFPFPKERFLVASPQKKEKVGMVLGIHENPLREKAGVTLLEKKDLWFPVGALFLDSCDDYLNPQIQEEFSLLFLNIDKVPPFFYKEPLVYAKEENIPIILGDITLRGYSVGEVAKKDLSLILSSSLASLSSVGLALENNVSRISRRKFLKKFFWGAVSGGLLGVVHFSTSGIIDICRKLGIRPDSEVGRDFQAIISDISHPENWILVMRNIVWALKIEDLYKREIISSDKIINVMGGSAHRFFDFFFRHPEVAKKYWRLFNYQKIAAKLSGGKPDWVYKSWIFYPGEKEGKIVTHESLKSLIE
jgi:hypothetical protein